MKFNVYVLFAVCISTATNASAEDVNLILSKINSVTQVERGHSVVGVLENGDIAKIYFEGRKNKKPSSQVARCISLAKYAISLLSRLPRCRVFKLETSDARLSRNEYFTVPAKSKSVSCVISYRASEPDDVNGQCPFAVR